MPSRPDPPALTEKYYSHESDEVWAPLEGFNSQVVYLLDAAQKGEIPHELVSLEILHGIATLYATHGFSNDAIMDAIPVETWRDEAVSVPLPILVKLMDAWGRYKNAPSGTTLGECLNVEGAGQGRTPARDHLERMRAERKLARAAIAEYLASGTPNSVPMAQSAVFATIAERNGVSADTVKRAYRKWKGHEYTRLRQAGYLSKETGE